MAGSRRIYTPQFKFQRALEAVKNDNLSETSRKYDINANVLLRWKKELMGKGSSIFADTPEKEAKELKNKIAKLEQMLGKKEVELNLLKNFSDFYGSRNSP